MGSAHCVYGDVPGAPAAAGSGPSGRSRWQPDSETRRCRPPGETLASPLELEVQVGPYAHGPEDPAGAAGAPIRWRPPSPAQVQAATVTVAWQPSSPVRPGGPAAAHHWQRPLGPENDGGPPDRRGRGGAQTAGRRKNSGPPTHGRPSLSFSTGPPLASC
jgi:hypothetical protein